MLSGGGGGGGRGEGVDELVPKVSAGFFSKSSYSGHQMYVKLSCLKEQKFEKDVTLLLCAIEIYLTPDDHPCHIQVN